MFSKSYEFAKYCYNFVLTVSSIITLMYLVILASSCSERLIKFSSLPVKLNALLNLFLCCRVVGRLSKKLLILCSIPVCSWYCFSDYFSFDKYKFDKDWRNFFISKDKTYFILWTGIGSNLYLVSLINSKSALYMMAKLGYLWMLVVPFIIESRPYIY